MSAGDVGRLPDGQVWVGFDAQGMSLAASVRRDGADWARESGLTPHLCEFTRGEPQLWRHISDFTIIEDLP